MDVGAYLVVYNIATLPGWDSIHPCLHCHPEHYIAITLMYNIELKP